MSEFTAGNLVLKKHYGLIKEYNPKYINELNSDWIVFFTEGTNVSDEYPRDIHEISRTVPVFYFYNFEDHGWGFYIIKEEKEESSFHYSYETEDILLLNLIESEFPGEDPIELLYLQPDSDKFKEKMIEKLYQDRSKEKEFEELLKYIDFKAFRLFISDEEIIKELKFLLSVENLISLDNHFKLVNDFKTLLNIKEMSWIRADRIGDD